MESAYDITVCDIRCTDNRHSGQPHHIQFLLDRKENVLYSKILIGNQQFLH